MEVYRLLLTASQLTNLLQILGALVADYINNPKGPMHPGLQPFVKGAMEWRDLPSLKQTIQTCLRGGDKMSALFELGAELKNAMPDFRNNQEFSTSELTMLRALRSYLSTDSPVALDYIRKNASVFGKPALASMFAPPIPKADNNALRRVVKSLVGRDGTHLTTDEHQMLTETNPGQLEQYKDLRKQHNLQFKATLINYVRNSGESKVDYQQCYRYMVKEGFTHSMVPGFIGLIDDQGRWYTKEGELISNVPNLSTYTNVVMNDGRDPTAQWVFKMVKPNGDYAYGYTVNFRRDQSSAKYEHVAELMQNIDEIQAAWRAKIKRFNLADKMSVAAVVLEILYSYAARVGSAPGRGVGTLLVKNASVTQAGVNLAYIGKDSIPTKHIIKSADDPYKALVVKALRLMIQDKKPSAFIFCTEVQGKTKMIISRVTPADINHAFHEFGAPSGVTVHKLRTCRGTTLFKQLMDKDGTKRPPATEKDAMVRYKEMTQQVGKLLNHKRGVGTDNESVTGTTAALSYIDGDLQLELFQRWGFRPPSALEKLLKGSEA